MSNFPWPATGRLLDSGPLPERFPGQYSDDAKARWQPWIDAARAGASLEELAELSNAIIASVTLDSGGGAVEGLARVQTSGHGPYALAVRGREFFGRLESYESYDGDENWLGVTRSLHLDEPVGEIVMVDLEDVLELYEGRRVRLTIEALDG